MKNKIKKLAHEFSEVIVFLSAVVFISIIIDSTIIGLAADDNRFEEASPDTSSTEDANVDELIAEFDCLGTIYEQIGPVEEEFAEYLDNAITSDENSEVVADLVMQKYEEYIAKVEAIYSDAVSTSF